MASCANHPDREAVAKCKRCGRSFCSVCLEEVGEFYYCFDCLKTVSREARAVFRGVLTVSIALGALICLAVGTVIFLEQLDDYLALVKAAQTGGDVGVKAFLTPQKASFLLPITLAVALYYALAIGLFLSKRWSFILALLLNLAVIGWALYRFSTGQIEPLWGFATIVAGPILVVTVALLNRHNLAA